MPMRSRTPDGVALLVGNESSPGATPVAMAYAGHQFGGFSPRLGDGRALLLGELVDGSGRRRDLHLKGSGRTPFARGGDGKAAVGPMLREYVISEAMHALGIPTTRSLAVVATGDAVARETMLPGAILVRVAASHLRVGTFQYAAGHDDAELLQRLADYAIARHHPDAADAANPYIAFFEAVVRRAGVADRPLDERRLHPRRDEHRQHDDLGRDDRLRAVRVHGRVRPGDRVQFDRPRRPVRVRQPAPDRAVEPRPAGRDAAAAVRPRRRHGGRDGDPDAAGVPRPISRLLERRHAGQDRPPRRRAERRRTGQRPARVDARAARRLHRVLPSAVARRSAAIANRFVCCSSSSPPSTRGSDTVARPGRARIRRICRRSRTRWTSSTRSTSRATTSSRRRSPRRPPATSNRSGNWSTCSPTLRRTARLGVVRRVRRGDGFGDYQTFCGT